MLKGLLLWKKNLISVKSSLWIPCTTKKLHGANCPLELCLFILKICILWTTLTGSNTLLQWAQEISRLCSYILWTWRGWPIGRVAEKSHSGIEIVKYYDGEWIQFLQSHHFNVEVYDFYCGYRCVIICGALVAPTGHYNDDCMIKVTADTIKYQWYT